VGRWALGVLFIVLGAAVNAIYLGAGTGYYEDFAIQSPFPVVSDTWESLVLLLLSGARWTEVGLIALTGFHIGQLAFGGVLRIGLP